MVMEHDWRLVLLASVICFMTSGISIGLFVRTQTPVKLESCIWLGLNALAAGCGIWATYFIVLLAFIPDANAGYSIIHTTVSLVIAVVLTALGFAVASRTFRPASLALGGAIVGSSVSAMHFYAMIALGSHEHVKWSLGLAACAVLTGIALGSAALVIVRNDDWKRLFVASCLLTAMVLSTHFIAMEAVVVDGDFTGHLDPQALSQESLAIGVAGVATIILGLCLIMTLSDHWTKKTLQNHKLLLGTALANMSQGLCMCDRKGMAVLYNDRLIDMWSPNKEFFTRHSFVELFDAIKSRCVAADAASSFFQKLKSRIDGESMEKTFSLIDGRSIRVIGRAMERGGWVATFEDITAWQEVEGRLNHMASHDALTDLGNRASFQEKLDGLLQTSEGQDQLAVLCIDLDHFKEVNDTLGHPVGDELLRAVAGRLQAIILKDEIVARLGGDEFAILLRGHGSQATQASILANRIIEAMRSPFEVQDQEVLIGASVGITVAPLDGKDPGELLKNADIALYRAKEEGRNTYRFFEVGMDARAQAKRIMLRDLRIALGRAEFEVYYQPIHDLNADEIVCFEALVRWKHPLRGMIAPGDFIPLAEETGLIVQLGDWVLQQACLDAATWPENISVAVNLSPVQLKNRNFVATVEAALCKAGLSADRLEFEITEAVLLQETAESLAALHSLREIGVRIAMDDFGTGYSSLSYLRSFPFDKIKIDQSFVRELASRNEAMAIVKAVTGLGRSLGIRTIAEGVETREQLALLKAEGCREVQGFLFSTPQPARDVGTMLQKRMQSVS